MNKITVSTQGCGDSPTLGSIKPGTIFQFLGKNPRWIIKTGTGSLVYLDSGSCESIHLPGATVTPLTGYICIEPE